MKYAFQIVVFFSSTPFGGNQLAVAHMRGRDAKLHPPAGPGERGLANGGCPMSASFARSAGECKTGMQSTSSARSEFCDGNSGCNRLEEGMVRN
jgi:hypothetical protein